MINGNRVIAVIPARGGSKGVSKKNIRILGDKPLVAWSIEVARSVKFVDRVIVSTDDSDIGVISKEYNAEVYNRPKHLASDDSLVIDTIIDLQLKLKNEGEAVDVVIMLEPTCPFRYSGDITKCLKLLVESNNNYDSVATFKEATLNPHRAWNVTKDKPKLFINNANPWLPRQFLPKAYQLDGGAYVFFPDKLAKNNVNPFGRLGAIIVDNSFSVDIDSEVDFIFAEALLKYQKKNE